MPTTTGTTVPPAPGSSIYKSITSLPLGLENSLESKHLIDSLENLVELHGLLELLGLNLVEFVKCEFELDHGTRTRRRAGVAPRAHQ